MMKLEIGSQEWLDARRNLITATDAGIILGLSPWKTSLQLYSDKINGTVTEQNDAMRRGLELEPEARVAFEQMTGHFVRPEFRIHPVFEWMAASFDGINDEGVVVEIKAPGEKDHHLALLGEVPAKYVAQLQHQMFVANVDECFYLSYRPGTARDCALIKVLADKEFQANMIEKEKAFWDSLQARIPPEPIGKDIQVREDRAWLMKEEELFRLNVMMDEFEEKREEIRKSMIEMCDGRITQGYRLKFTPVIRKGNIDYSKIEALKDLDLEVYRKPGTSSWRVDTV